MAWYIDAWAVLDGVAFISEREAGANDARQTVFVSAPEFSPVPIARIATAWAAARGHFQERLFGPTDTEVAFATLAQAIETVRRGFRKGGGDAPGGLLAPYTVPGGESSDENSGPPPFAGDETSKYSWNEVIGKVEDLESHNNRLILAEAFREAYRSQDLRDVLLQYAADVQATLLRSMYATGDSWEEIGLFDRSRVWWPLFLFTGLSNPKRRDSFFPDFEKRMKQPMELLDFHGIFPYGVDWHGEARTLRDSLLGGMLFQFPLPSGWPTKDNATSIGDSVCRACADRQLLLLEIQDVRLFAPVLLAALMLALAKLGLPRLVFRNGQSLQNNRIDAIYEVAGNWLAAALPGRELKDHAAEDVIAKLSRVDQLACA